MGGGEGHLNLNSGQYERCLFEEGGGGANSRIYGIYYELSLNL